MPRNRLARKEFFANYVNILFMVLSLIQGLAFQDVAQKARIIIPKLWGVNLLGSPHAWVQICYTALCLAVIVRVLQTYITVALDYGPKYVTLHDILVVFLVGLIEAFLFNELGDTNLVNKLAVGQNPNDVAFFKPVRFWIAMASMSTLACVVYFLNVKKVASTEPKFLSIREEYEEQTLQALNSAFMAFLAVFSCFVAWYAHSNNGKLDNFCSFIFTGVAILTLGTTTAVSLSNTFGIRAFFTNDVHDAFDGGNIPSKNDNQIFYRNTMTVRLAIETDISFIVEHAFKKYHEIFAALFGVSQDRVQDILREFVRANDANSFLARSYWLMVTTTKDPSPGQRGDANEVLTGGVLVYSNSSSNSEIVSMLGKAMSKPSRLDKIAYWLFSNRRRPIGGYSDIFITSQLGAKGAAYLRDKVDAFIGPELHEGEIRLRLAFSIPQAKEEDVIDCVLDELYGEGELSGIVLPTDKALQSVLHKKHLSLLEEHPTTIITGGQQVTLRHFKRIM